MAVSLKSFMFNFKFLLQGSKLIGLDIDSHETKHMNIQQNKDKSLFKLQTN
jgi:hypothetical protein